MTNYEKYIKMTADELATKIMCPYGSDGETCAEQCKNCNACCLKFLESEAK